MADAEKRAHTEFGHALLVQDLDFDAELLQGLLRLFGKALRVEDVGRLGAEIARGEHALADLLEFRVELLRSGMSCGHDRQPAEARLALRLLRGPVLVEAVASQLGAEGDTRRGLRRLDSQVCDRIDGDGRRLLTHGIELRQQIAANPLQVQRLRLRCLAQAEQDHAADGQAGRGHNLQHLALAAGKAAALDCAGQRPPETPVQVGQAGGQRSAIGDQSGNGAGLRLSRCGNGNTHRASVVGSCCRGRATLARKG